MKMFSLESSFVPQVRLKEKLQHEMFPSKNEVTCIVSDTNIFVVMSKVIDFAQCSSTGPASISAFQLLTFFTESYLFERKPLFPLLNIYHNVQ